MSELGQFLGKLARDREEDKQNLTDFGEQPTVPLFPIELTRLKDNNLELIRSDSGDWLRRSFQWVTTEDFNTWTLDADLSTENNEIKMK